MRAPKRIETLFKESCIYRMTPGQLDEFLIVTRRQPIQG
jgi:hypothetical protein